MSRLESILGSDELAQEIAQKVALLQPGVTAVGGAPESTLEGLAEPVISVSQPTMRTAPVLLDDVSPDGAREAIHGAVSASGVNEAIVKRFGRPALLVRNDTFEMPVSDFWKALLFPYKGRLDAAIPCVGRVEIVSTTPPYIGTAWMVTDDIAVTNRHVAMAFARRDGNGWKIRRNPIGQPYQVRVDFKEEYLRTTPYEADVVEIVYIAELDDSQPDIAFLRLHTNGQPLPAPIPLFDGDLTAGQKIAVIGYPAEDARNGAADQDRIFANIFDVKRLAPGEITAVPDSFYFTHDCSTLGGNSGSVVLDVETGTAVGLHFAGEYLLANYAVRGSTVREFLENLRPGVAFAEHPVAPQLESFTASVEDMQDRAGYDANFLGEDELAVPLPEFGEGLAEMATVIDETAEGMGRHMLDYTHFSLAMHQDRRMAIFTATNIDGDQAQRIKRSNDAWGLDPRIPDEAQFGNELYYNNELDRGHLVRRLDPVWGEDEEAKEAEKDTFFYTNCAPQHSSFNRRLWLGLEDYLLENTTTRGFKATVFTGPIFSDADRPYREAKLPLAYWKVAVMVHDTRDELTATGYIVSQQDLVSNLEFVFGQFKTYQVPIAAIEARTNLSFGDLVQFDPLATEEAIGYRELVELEDIAL
jgi:endonuclease G